MGRSSAGTVREALRVQNQHAILQTVHRQGPISRTDIALKLNLSPAAVTNIAGELIDRNLLFEAGQAEASGVGRRAILLEVDYGHALVAGVKVSNAAVTCAVTKLNAEVVTTAVQSLPDTEPETVAAVTLKTLSKLVKKAGRFSAVGVILPGIVDPDGQTVRHSPLLGWTQLPFGQELEARLGVQVTVENDVNALALAQAWFGYGQHHDSFLVVTLGRGVGLGIVLNGEVYRGPNGGAGEFGHVLVDPAGPDSRHAKRGTLETYLSDDALLRETRTLVPGFEDNDPDELVRLAHNGHPGARAIYAAAGTVLGRALSTLVNIFAPGLIILSGEGMRAADFLLPTARVALKEHSFGDLAARLELVVAPWGDDAWARGAAGLAASRYLTEAAAHIGGG